MTSRYRETMVWSDMTIAYATNYRYQYPFRCYRPCCAFVSPPDRAFRLYSPNSPVSPQVWVHDCFANLDRKVVPAFALCEKVLLSSIAAYGDRALPLNQLGAHDNTKSHVQAMVTCLKGHVTHCFLAADTDAACWEDGGMKGPGDQQQQQSSCSRSLRSVPPHFVCVGSQERLAYTLVCDHRQDCWDSSDEDFCFFPPCAGRSPLQCSRSRQCYPHTERCNKQTWCLDKSDEDNCSRREHFVPEDFTPPPALVHLDGRGQYSMEAMPSSNSHNNSNISCPDTHLLCPKNGYCLPVFVRCDGVYDCTGQEDEAGCEEADCPGYYRCRRSAVCLHPDHMCDGVFHCPQRDDELLCNLTCPSHCTCVGLAFRCVGLHRRHSLPADVRALDASGGLVVMSHLLPLQMLVYLSLADCQLQHVAGLAFPNLQTLRLSHNFITSLSLADLTSIPKLTTLFLADNPIKSLFSDNQNASVSLDNMRLLDLSNVSLSHVDVRMFRAFPSLTILNLSGCGVERLTGPGLGSLSQLQTIDLRGSADLDFPPTLFVELSHLQQVRGDTHKLCCAQVLPADFNTNNCQAPVSPISSCDNLLRSTVYRLFLAVFAAVALTGNTGSLLFRARSSKASTGSGYSAFVTHLCVADGLMGVYLVVVGVADRVYENSYLWQDVRWRNSTVCQSSGFLALLSTEMSAFIILLITLDRFLVIRAPFSQLRFQRRSAHAACCLHWAAVCVLAAVPFLPACRHWGFYSHTDICLPLPITRSSFAGHSYAFAVMIVLNMTLFLAIAAGQAAIYMAIRSNTLASAHCSSRKSQDLDIARRLITVALTDFCCWFPVGLLAVLAAAGTPVPGEMNVAMATLVVPVNSAINPFLYTVNVLLEKRRQAREARLLHFMRSLKDAD